MESALDGIKLLAQAASDVVTQQGSQQEPDRLVVAAVSEVERACLSLLCAEALAPVLPREKESRWKLGGLSSLLGMGSPAREAGAGAGSSHHATAAAPAAAAQLQLAPAPLTPAERGAVQQQQYALHRAQMSPITDIIAVAAGEPLPPGFQRVSHSITGAFPADLNAVSGMGAARAHVHACLS